MISVETFQLINLFISFPLLLDPCSFMGQTENKLFIWRKKIPHFRLLLSFLVVPITFILPFLYGYPFSIPLLGQSSSFTSICQEHFPCHSNFHHSHKTHTHTHIIPILFQFLFHFYSITICSIVIAPKNNSHFCLNIN